MGRLTGKVALVTGSGRNIGRTIILEMAREGAHVVVNTKANRSESEAVAKEAQALGVKAINTLADVSDKAQVDAMFSQALAEFGQVDILVSNAAIRPQKIVYRIICGRMASGDWRDFRRCILLHASRTPHHDQ